MCSLRIIRRCEDLGIPTVIVPRLFERMPELTQMEHLGGLPLVAPRPARAWTAGSSASSTPSTACFAALALLILSPILLAAALVLLITLGRPVFFRQMRIGRDGRPFEMLKFRTMAGEAEEPAVAPRRRARPGRSGRRGPAHASRLVPAPDLDRRAAAARATSCAGR